MDFNVIEIRCLHRILDATEAIDHEEVSASFNLCCGLKLAILCKKGIDKRE
jgi:hypothetical protein